MAANLKPCPFCGSAPELRSSHGWYAVGCYTAKCPASIHALTHRSESAAVATWNTRPPGVSALPTPKLCPGCAQYHGRNDCPVGWLAPAEPYGVKETS